MNAHRRLRAQAARPRSSMLLVLLLVAGVVGFIKLNIEAYPDPVPPLVDIVTQSPGQSAEEIERYITIPIEVQMAGIPHVTADAHDLAVRPFRREGAVHLRLHLRAGRAMGHQPPVAAAAAAQRRAAADLAGEPDRRDLPLSRGRARRAIPSPISRRSQDWMLERRFKAVPGVIDVTGWGGKTKTYEVTVDLRPADRLRPVAAAGAAGAQQQQHQCRRPDRQHRAAGGGGARRRPHPLDGRHPRHHADREQRHCRC